jgi:hypothetical protein
MWKFLFGVAFGLAVVVGMLNLGPVNEVAAGNQVAAPNVVVAPGWRFTDGYWNYWDAGDRSWYYTDGRHWYTYDNNAWRNYNFDRNFGRSAFVREGYVPPAAGVEIPLPRHRIYVPVP